MRWGVDAQNVVELDAGLPRAAHPSGVDGGGQQWDAVLDADGDPTDGHFLGTITD